MGEGGGSTMGQLGRVSVEEVDKDGGHCTGRVDDEDRAVLESGSDGRILRECPPLG